MAEEPKVGKRFYHVPVSEGEVPRYVLLPGAPERVDTIAGFMDSVDAVRQHREFRVAIGTYRGVSVAAVSTGIGGPSTSIAVEELVRAGANTLIRVGTCGALQEHVRVGDVVVASAAVRLDGASDDYAPPWYPASGSPELVLLLAEMLERMGARYHVGLVASASTFYTGQGRRGVGGFLPQHVEGRLEELRRLRVLCFEMETATLYVMGLVYGLRVASVCAAIANRVTGEFKPEAGVDKAIKAALDAVAVLDKLDRGGLKPLPSSIASAIG